MSFLNANPRNYCWSSKNSVAFIGKKMKQTTINSVEWIPKTFSPFLYTHRHIQVIGLAYIFMCMQWIWMHSYDNGSEKAKEKSTYEIGETRHLPNERMYYPSASNYIIFVLKRSKILKSWMSQEIIVHNNAYNYNKHVFTSTDDPSLQLEKIVKSLL